MQLRSPLAAGLLIAACVGCGGPPQPIQYQSGGLLPATTAEGLHRVRATRLSAAYLKPGASFAQYDGILIDPVTIAYKKGAAARTGRKNFFELDDSALERMERMFQEAFAKSLGRSKS